MEKGRSEAHKPQAAPAKVPAAVYARISRDRDGAGLGVERQEADCRALAARLGWDVVAVYVDNDISAYSGRPRPQYRAMLDAVRAGRVCGVLAWHPDRLHRKAVELEEFVTIAEAHSLQVQTVKAGQVDLSTPSGRMVARMLGAAAQHEVEQTRARLRAQKQRAAADGQYRGGRRPFGYRKDGVTVREDEAQVLRDATHAILAGRSLIGVAEELNEAGRRTSTNREWSRQTLRDVLLRPRNAGLIHSGVVGHPDMAIVGPASWPAIVDTDTWRAVYSLLTGSSRRTGDGNAKRHLGSGIYRCGLCGAFLRAATYGGTPKRAGPRVRIYRCEECHHISVNAAPTDAFVREQVAALVRDPRVVAAMSPDSESHLAADRERRAVLAARLESFERDYADGSITGAQLAKATWRVTAEMEQVDVRLAEGMQQNAASPVLRAADPGRVFLDAPIDVQRAVLSAVLTVTVVPQVRRGAAWTAERLRLEPVA